MIVGLLHTFEKDDSVGFTMVGANIRDEENEMHETLCKAVSEAREQGLKNLCLQFLHLKEIDI